MIHENPAYPDTALKAFIKFSNENLPLSKLPLDQLQEQVLIQVQEAVKEVKSTLATLAAEDIRAYGEWLDKRIRHSFDCISYEGRYLPIDDFHRIVSSYPKNAVLLLDDMNPEKKNQNHKLSHRCSAILQRALEIFEKQVSYLRKMKKAGYAEMN